jgi:hypothetical protein
MESNYLDPDNNRSTHQMQQNHIDGLYKFIWPTGDVQQLY